MKRKDFIAELKSLDKDALLEKVRVLSEELMKLRFRKSTGQLEHFHRIGQAKKELARTATEISTR